MFNIDVKIDVKKIDVKTPIQDITDVSKTHQDLVNHSLQI